MADEKVFKIRIDGIEQSYKNSVKLLDALVELNRTIDNVNNTTTNIDKTITNSINTVKQKTKTLTEEEKAQKKLADTQDKSTRVITTLEKEQEKANQQLKERTEYLEDVVRLETSQADTIAKTKAQLKILNKEWENVTVGSEKFEELTAKIAELNAKLKEAEEAKNAYVGGNELETIFKNLGDTIDATTTKAQGILNLFQAGVGFVLLFDEKNEGLQNTMNQLGKVIAVVTALQSFNEKIIKKGTAATIANTAVEKVRTIQTLAAAKATELSTKNTVLATVAQSAFNIVAKANPYLLLATGLFTLIGAVVGYSESVDDAEKKTRSFKSALDDLVFSSAAARDAHDSHIQKMRELNMEYDVLTGKITSYEAKIKKINDDKNDKEREEINRYKEEIAKIEEDKLNEQKKIRNSLSSSITIDQAVVANKANIQLENAKQEHEKIMAEIDEEAKKEIVIEEVKQSEKIKKIQEQNHIESLRGQQRELAQLKANKDEQIKTAESLGIDKEEILRNYEKRKKEIQNKYAREAEERDKNKYENTLKYTRQYEDLLTKAISSEYEKRATQINISYERQIEDLERTLEKEKKLTTEAKEAINKIIKELEFQQKAELEKLDIEQKNKEKEQNLKKLEDRKKLLDLEATNNKNFYDNIKEVSLKPEKGIINVKQIEKELEDANKNLKTYISMVEDSKSKLTTYYDDLLNLYESDSYEYKKTLQEKEAALKTLNEQTSAAEKAMSDNTEKQSNLRKEYWEQLSQKIKETSEKITNETKPLFDAANAILKMELEDAQAKFDEISKKYDEIVKKREESTNRIQELEKQAQNARGGRSLVLQSQIEKEIEANKKLAEQEQKLAKDKEKLEKEKAKKEKQRKKLELAQNIIQGLVNIAVGVTKAWALGPLVGPAMAAVVSAAGAIQVGIMTKQLSKLEDGGLLKGKRHREGGMRVEGTNIEVEGGEYVINRISTNKNLGLIKYINSQRKELDANDINTFFGGTIRNIESPFRTMFESGGQLPIVTNTGGINREDIQALNESIQSINIEPVVSVVDINNAQTETIRIEDFAGI